MKPIDDRETRQPKNMVDRNRGYFRSIFENSLEGVLLAIPDTGEVLYANPAALEMLQMTEDEACQAGRNGIVVWNDAFENVMEERQKHGRWRGEITYRRKDGSMFPVELSSSYFSAPDRTILLNISFRDITQRRRWEETLKESEEKYRAVVEHSNDGIIVIQDGVIKYANPRMAELDGNTMEQLIGTPITDHIHPEDMQRITDLYRKRMAGEPVPGVYEARLKRRDGSRAWAELNVGLTTYQGKPAALATIRDITDRKQMEDALRKIREELETRVEERTAELEHEKRLLQTIVDNIPVMLTFYKMSGEVVFMNKALERVIGWSIQDLVCIDVIEQLYPDPDYRKKIWDFMKNPGPYWKDIRIRTRDGRFVDTRWMNVRLPDESQIGIGLDVTDQLQLEEQLRHSQKMEALGTMTGGVAHDFNNILAAVIGFAEMAKEELPKEGPGQHFVEQVLKAGLRGRDLVRQMLTFSRKNGEGRKPMKLSDSIWEAMKLIRPSIPTTITIKLDVENNAGMIWADPTQIQQIIVNLCNNAADAMSETGGIMAVKLGDFTVSGNHPVAALAPGPYVRLSVSDTGKGMDRQVLERVFEPFYTTKEPGKGTGLGLSIVHGIISNYGGEILAESTSGVGTTFFVFLPHLKEEPARQEEEAVLVPGGGGERVLFLDDEKELVDLATKMMQALGYRVTGKTSSRETLETLKNDPSAFDLIISDQTMPEMTGMQLSRALKTIGDIPFILTTGYSQFVNADSAREAGISAFVMKPLTKSELARTIRKVLDKKRLKGSTWEV